MKCTKSLINAPESDRPKPESSSSPSLVHTPELKYPIWCSDAKRVPDDKWIKDKLCSNIRLCSGNIFTQVSLLILIKLSFIAYKVLSLFWSDLYFVLDSSLHFF